MWAQPDYSHLAAREPIAAAFRDVFERVGARASRRRDRHLGDAGAGAAQGEAAAGGRARAGCPTWPRSTASGCRCSARAGTSSRSTRTGRRRTAPTSCRSPSSTLSDTAGNVYGLWHGTDCRVLYYRKDLVPKPPRTWDELIATATPHRAARRASPATSTTPAAGRRRVFDHLPMFWGQGGELVDADGRPIFGQPPHRERMVKLLRFLRDTVESGASPRSVLGRQRLQAALVGRDRGRRRDVPGRQLADAASCSTACRRKSSRSGTSRRSRRRSAGTRSDRHRRLGLGRSSPRTPRSGARRPSFIRFIESTRQRRAHQRARPATCPCARACTATSPSSATTRGSRASARCSPTARARPAVPIYPFISEQLQLAIGYAVAGSEDARGRGRRRVARRRGAMDARQRAAARGRPASTPWLLVAPLAIAALLPLALALSSAARGELVLWLAAGAGARRAGAASTRCWTWCGVAFSDARTGRAGHALRPAELPRPARRPRVLGDARRDARVRGRLRRAAARRRPAASRSRSTRRAARGARAARWLVRVAVVSAWVVPGVLVGVLWKILLVENRAGIANYPLSLLGIGPLPLALVAPRWRWSR